MAKIKEQLAANSPRRWDMTNGTYISGRAAIDGADTVALAMELRWGAGRLRLLVDEKLREKFDRQRFLWNSALWHGDLAELQLQATRMIKAWQALDAAAVAAHAPFLSPEVWEVALADGTVVALVQSSEEAHAVVTEGRKLVVYTMDEIARMLQNYHEVTRVKDIIPGAEVVAIRRTIDDPLNMIRDATSLDDRLDDILPEYAP